MTLQKNILDSFGVTSISVGEKFTLYENSHDFIGVDAVALDVLEEDCGYFLTIFYQGINDTEVYNFKNLTPYVRMLKTEEGLVLLLIKYGNTAQIIEAAFNPTIYNDYRALRMKENRLITTICIDSNNNIIKGIRSSSLPGKLVEECLKSWKEAYSNKDYTALYHAWYQDLQRKYTTAQLWELAEDVGYFGDDYIVENI